MVPWGTKNQVILTGNNIAQGTFNATKQVSVGKDVIYTVLLITALVG